MVGKRFQSENNLKAALKVIRKLLKNPTINISDNVTLDKTDLSQNCRTQITRVQKREFSDTEIKKIIEDYRHGKTTYQLAKEIGCHRLTIGNILKKNKIIVSNAKAQEKLNTERVIALYKDYYTTSQIAKLYRVNPNAIIDCLKKQGIKIRNRWDYPKGEIVHQIKWTK